MNLINTKTKILIVGLIVLIILTVALTFVFNQPKREPQTEVDKLPPSQQVGMSDQYSSDITKNNKKDQAYFNEGQKVSQFRQSLPVKENNYSARYSVENNVYIVKPEGGSEEEAKKEFEDDLKTRGISLRDINVVYNTNPSDFFVLKTNITADKKMGVAEAVKITFSDPLERESSVIKIEPDVPAFFDFNKSFTEVLITPTQGWGFGKSFKIIVSGVNKDKDGKELSKEYVYTFQTQEYSGI